MPYGATVPVVVTAADHPLGRAVVAALSADGVQVRATVRPGSPAAVLGVPTAVTDFSDGLRAGAVLEGAHTIVHLDAAVPWEWLVDAAEDSGVRRMVLVLPPGAPVPHADGYDVVVVEGDVATSGRGEFDRLVTAIVAADARADRRPTPASDLAPPPASDLAPPPASDHA
jgi:hypothetical protein